MANYNKLITIIVLFNYCLLKVLAENNYYIVSILRNKNDNNYDDEKEQVQKEIDKLVNDRMNDIYDIILENKDTYAFENGTIDEKLNELSKTSELRQHDNNKKTKFLFINKNIFNKTRSFNETSLIEESEEEDIKYIPLDSDLVSHICPVLNYYTIRVYLSDVTLKKIESIPNIFYYEMSAGDSSYSVFSTKQNQFEIPNKRSFSQQIQDNHEKYYNKKEILDETNWKDVEVQENQFLYEYGEVNFNYLSIISQGQYIPGEDTLYDNNYYYPSSAGKGVDIFVVDTGLHTSLFPSEFDNYEGTPDERTISCDGNIYNGKYHPVNATEKYDCTSHNILNSEYGYYIHGTHVSIAAAGTINGAAKKANIHALAIEIESESVLVAMDYIKKNGLPHKTVINFSFGILHHSQAIQDKLNEMVKDGFIFVIAAGNRGTNVCTNTEDLATYNGFITVGAIAVNDNYVFESMDPFYTVDKPRYSDYGECVDIFAPGYFQFRSLDSGNIVFDGGTSFASPLVVGVAATLISDRPEIKYDYHQMKQTLIDLSLKDVIENLKDNSPNRILNNGKHISYQPPRCNHSSGKYSCSNNSCCSVHGFCIDSETSDKYLKSLCYIENECQSEFGICYDGYCNYDNSDYRCTDEFSSNTINDFEFPTEVIYSDLDFIDVSTESPLSFEEDIDSDDDLNSDGVKTEIYNKEYY